MTGQVVRAALWGVRSAPVRSITTIVAVASAACCVLFCSAIIGGFDETLRRMSFGYSATALTVRPNPITNGRTGPPTDDDLRGLRSRLTGITAEAAWVEGTAAFQLPEGTVTVPVYGGTGDYRQTLDTALVAGRWPTRDDMSGNARFCLLGRELADRLGHAAIPGQALHLNGLSCEIVGIMAYPDTRPAKRFAQGIVMPIGPARRYFADSDMDRRDLSWFTLFFADATRADDARASVDGALRKLHGIPQSRLSPYSYDDTDADTRDQERQRQMMARLLGSVTTITLLVSVLSYTSVLLGACRSRAREFAIRMAMGALRGDIIRQVILENIVLTLAGSISGVALGIVLANFANLAWGWPTIINWSLILATAVGSITAGILIGTYGGVVAGATPPAAAARS